MIHRRIASPLVVVAVEAVGEMVAAMPVAVLVVSRSAAMVEEVVSPLERPLHPTDTPETDPGIPADPVDPVDPAGLQYQKQTLTGEGLPR